MNQPYGTIVFTGGYDSQYKMSADLAIKALRQTGLLVSSRAGEALAGELELLQVLKMADWLGFEAGHEDAGRGLHKLVRQVLDNNPDIPAAWLRVWYRYVSRNSQPEVYSRDFINLRHTIFMSLVSRNATVKEENLTPEDCRSIIIEAGFNYHERHGHGIIPRQVKTNASTST